MKRSLGLSNGDYRPAICTVSGPVVRMNTSGFRRGLSILGAVGALGVSSAACHGGSLQKPVLLGPVDTGPGTLEQARRYLQGRWVLVSMDLFPPNQPPIHAAAEGSMQYDDFGNMDVELRLNPATANLAESIGIHSANGIVSTTGRTVIDINNHSISYVLEGQAAVRPALSPLDTNRPRFWEVAGPTLTLRTKDENGTVLSVSVWRKQAPDTREQ